MASSRGREAWAETDGLLALGSSVSSHKDEYEGQAEPMGEFGEEASVMFTGTGYSGSKYELREDESLEEDIPVTEEPRAPVPDDPDAIMRWDDVSYCPIVS